MNRKIVLAPAFVSSAMLYLAVVSWPYDFYVVLRWVVCASAIYLSYLAYSEYENEKTWLFIFIPIALIFNPLIPLHLEKTSWVYIDVLAALFFASSFYVLERARLKDRETEGSIGPI
jgi:hypothetical protein